MDGQVSMRVSDESSAAVHTADCAVFGFSQGEMRVLLVHRTAQPFAGQWLLPGGAMSATETLEETARRVLLELVGVRDVALRQVRTYSAPDRHPVRRVITTSFYALVRPEHHQPVARDYLNQAVWHRLAELPRLAIDHGKLLTDAHAQLISHLRDRPMAFDLLPSTFTLTEAQQLYESILGEALDRRNFRRKLLAYDFLVDTGEKRAGVQGGPALYRLDTPALQRQLKL